MNRIFNKPDYFYLAIALTMTTLVIGAVFTTVDVFKAEKKINRFEDGMVMENEQFDELTFENLQISNSNGGEVKNVISDANDKRTKSYEDWSQDVNPSNTGNPEKNAKEFEEQLWREAEGNEARKKLDEEKKIIEEKVNIKNSSVSNVNSKGGSQNQFAGNVMVKFSLSGRTAFNGNNWYVRNPGYTCGKGSGVVLVNVTVGRDGKVEKAIVDHAQSSGNVCMKEQAQKYALISRFSISSTAPENQTGFIRYEFVSQ